LFQEQFDNFSPEQKQFYKNNFNEVLDKAAEEWNIISPPDTDENDKFNCELCGQPIIYPARIQNVFNKKILIVGSTCVTKYKNITDVNGKNFEEIEKEKTEMLIRHNNENKMESLSPNIVSDFSKIRNFEKENTNYLTFELALELNDFLSENLPKYDIYINKKNIKQSEINELITMHKKAKKLINKLYNYIEFCQTNIVGLNTLICDWCNQYASEELKIKLREDGKITENTIGEIKEGNFMKKILPEFEKLLLLNNLKFYDKNQLGSTFKIQLNDIRKIIINVNSSMFLKKYSNFFFKNTQFSINNNDIINIGTITDEKSLYSALMYIFEDTKINRDFNVILNDADINELAIQSNNKQIYVVKYKDFIQRFKYIIFNNKINENDKKAIVDYIKKNSKKYTYDNYRKYLKQYHIYI